MAMLKSVDLSKYDVQKIRETAECLKLCFEHDSCEMIDCAYFHILGDVEQLVEFVEEIVGDSDDDD